MLSKQEIEEVFREVLWWTWQIFPQFLILGISYFIIYSAYLATATDYWINYHGNIQLLP